MTAGMAVGRWLTVMVAAGCALAQSTGSAIIVNSGSTNTAGFQIVVDKSGHAEYTESTRRHRPAIDKTSSQPIIRKLPDKLAKRFYSDLKKAQPLGTVPAQRCFKSASFGTKLTIELGGEETPDLGCPDQPDARAQNLQRDANEIVNLFRKN